MCPTSGRRKTDTVSTAMHHMSNIFALSAVVRPAVQSSYILNAYEQYLREERSSNAEPAVRFETRQPSIFLKIMK